MSLKKLQILSLSCVFTFQCVGQSKLLKYGSLSASFASVEEFREQNELMVSNGWTMDSAVAIFNIPNEGLGKVKFFPIRDSLKYNQWLQKLAPGASVIFKAFVKSGNVRDSVIKNYLFVGLNRNQITNSTNPLYGITTFLTETNFTRGVIYFSGPFFKKTFKVYLPDKREIKNALSWLSSGSLVVYENVSWKDGSEMHVLNDTFTIP